MERVCGLNFCALPFFLASVLKESPSIQAATIPDVDVNSPMPINIRQIPTILPYSVTG